jgi:hypothetical protein
VELHYFQEIAGVMASLEVAVQVASQQAVMVEAEWSVAAVAWALLAEPLSVAMAEMELELTELSTQVELVEQTRVAALVAVAVLV